MKHHPIIVPNKWGGDVHCTCSSVSECSNTDMCHMIIGYMCGRKPPHYPVPAMQRTTAINPWSVVTFECRETYDHNNRVWEFDTENTPHMEWYR